MESFPPNKRGAAMAAYVVACPGARRGTGRRRLAHRKLFLALDFLHQHPVGLVALWMVGLFLTRNISATPKRNALMPLFFSSWRFGWARCKPF